ncbi:hypothetical protein CISG_07920 [Coccidioides immitis RMSCC 3703]|uniref:Secreted protein n=1 Tax=Coccidioides immitis RMSCC 3703 TaxID=454286 RepID=A0A0J8R7W6_COCIT|nr:hypothetical protein CISG_07920 [Coccidioides immitis RMSCC 3703]
MPSASLFCVIIYLSLMSVSPTVTQSLSQFLTVRFWEAVVQPQFDCVYLIASYSSGFTPPAVARSAAKKRDRLDLLTLIGRRGQYPSSLHGQVYGTSSDLHALGLRSLLSRPTLHNRLEDSMSDVLRLPHSVPTYAHTFSIQKSRTSAGFRAPEKNAS